MNKISSLFDAYIILEYIKETTQAENVSLSSNWKGITVRADWWDSCHSQISFSVEELVNVEIDLVRYISNKMKEEHEKLHKKMVEVG